MIRLFCFTLYVCLFVLQAQQAGILQGTVTDETGAVIPGANVTLTAPGFEPRSTSTDENGQYRFTGLRGGTYSIRVETAGFALFEKADVPVSSGVVTFDAPLKVQAARQEVSVEGESRSQISTDPSQNAGAIVLRDQDLAALSDDPDDLASDLQALAGPAAGPNGGQIFVDGFSGGRLPPKSAIREVRINSNPFAAEYDRLGFGRIEILTKPGADKFRGTAFFNFSDESLNARNPFAANKGSFQSRFYGFDIGGPLNKRTSYSLQAERRGIDDNAIINATILDPSLQTSLVQQAVQTPLSRWEVTPRIDFQINERHTLVGRYQYDSSTNDLSGIGDFSLQSRAFRSERQEHTVRLTETAILSPTAINEIRLQYSRGNNAQLAAVNEPAINVLGNFNAGGNPIGNSSNRDSSWEISNIASLSRGRHSIKIGGRLRTTDIRDISPQNFLGTFTFGGGLAPVLDDNFNPVLGGDGVAQQAPISSLERYRRTLALQALGLSPDVIRTLGGGATQFSIAAGTPQADVSQFDVALFAQDDWRVRPNLTLSLGLRLEGQNNVNDNFNFAPRIGFAWAPGQSGTQSGRTVIRGGVGMFYDRVGQNLYLQTLRFNGLTQQQYILDQPNFFPNVPTVDQLAGSAARQTIRTFDPDLKVPYLIQTAIGVERQLPRNSTIAVTYTFSRGVHLLRSSSIVDPANRLFEYKSDGILNQNQIITNFNTRFSSRVTLFSFYALNFARSNVDGTGSFPAIPGRLDLDYGRAANDVRHRLFIGGSLTAPWNLRLSPFIIANSGAPFNITSGRDVNGDLVFTDRPAFATDLSRPGVIVTPYGAFDPNPVAGANLVPRNYGEGPGYFSVNLRLSRTFGFGEVASAEPRGDAQGGGGRRGGMMMGGPGGGRRGGGGGGFRGGGGFGESTNKRYNLTLSVQVRNLLNTVNPASPIGDLSSSRFGQSNQLAGGFGGGGGGGAAGAAANRRLELQLRFAF
jgi:hypothetical protein